MDSIDVIRRMHQHRIWASRRLREVVRPLEEAQLRQPFAIGRGSLWATLVHLYGAELVWLEALRGNAEATLAGEDAFETFEELQVAWAALDRRWERYLEGLMSGALVAPVVRIRNHNGATMAIRSPALDVLLHVCTHAQYTTAQAVNMLRQLGVEPEKLPDSQMITMSREEQQ